MVAVAQTTMVYESGQTYSGKIELHSLALRGRTARSRC